MSIRRTCSNTSGAQNIGMKEIERAKFFWKRIHRFRLSRLSLRQLIPAQGLPGILGEMATALVIDHVTGFGEIRV